MGKTAQGEGELGLIERIRRQAGRRRSRLVPLGIGDDCAILRPPTGHEVLVTTDFSLEGRHFRRDWHAPEAAGHRCLARGLSDLAAMGATPMAAFLSLALPSSLPKGWVDRFFRGLLTLADRHKVSLAGGDTAESPADLILADITLVGTAPAGRALRRSGARAGDRLYVTGALGGAAAELDRMRAGTGRKVRAGSWLQHPQMFPEPRVAVGQWLLKKGWASACIDLSDGLSSDLAHLCRESGVRAEVEEAALPLHPLALKLGTAPAAKKALDGGEDYELLFTAPASLRMPSTIAGVPTSAIGQILRKTAGQPQVTLLGATGDRTELRPGGWEHFQDARE